jgi:hypothetical protein
MLDPGQEVASARQNRLRAFYPTVLRSSAGTPFQEFITEPVVEGLAVTGVPFHWTADSISDFVGAFTGMTAHADDIVFLGDVACVHWSATGRQVATFAKYPATNQVETISGVDLIGFEGANINISRHLGWIDEVARNRELTPTRERSPGPSPPVDTALTSAGEALMAVSRQNTAGDHPFGWRLELDAPRWALTEKKDLRSMPGLGIALAVVLLGVGLLLLLRDLLVTNGPQVPEAVSIALACGVGASALALALVGWRAIAGWRATSSVHIDVRRTVPSRVDFVSGATAAGGDVTSTADSTVTYTDRPAEQSGGPDSQPTTPANVVGKEPVLAGSTLIGGGTLALGLAGGVEPPALGAIAAVAVAIGGLLIRQLVTPDGKNQRTTAPESD